MNIVELHIPHHKTVMLLVRNCKPIWWLEIVVAGHAIALRRLLNHMGVKLADWLNLNGHVDYICEKMANAMNAITKIIGVYGLAEP